MIHMILGVAIDLTEEEFNDLIEIGIIHGKYDGVELTPKQLARLGSEYLIHECLRKSDETASETGYRQNS